MSATNPHRRPQSTVNTFKSPGKRYVLRSNICWNVQSQSRLFQESLKSLKASFLGRIAVSESPSVLGIRLSLGINTRPRRLCPLRRHCELVETHRLENKAVCLSVKHLAAAGKRQLLPQRFLLKALNGGISFIFFNLSLERGLDQWGTIRWMFNMRVNDPFLYRP